MSDVYVLGVDMIKFGRFPERTVPDLGSEAALLALDDASKIWKLFTVVIWDKLMQWLVNVFCKK